MEINIVIVLLVFIALLIVIYFVSLKGNKKDESWKFNVKNKLSSINKSINSNDQLILKSSLIEADKLLDFALKSKKVNGETLGERLKSAKTLYDKQTYNNIWEAHKLRNILVHEINPNINSNQLREGINKLKKGIEQILGS